MRAVADSPLWSTLLPSVFATTAPAAARAAAARAARAVRGLPAAFRYHVYVGVDADDPVLAGAAVTNTQRTLRRTSWPTARISPLSRQASTAGKRGRARSQKSGRPPGTARRRARPRPAYRRRKSARQRPSWAPRRGRRSSGAVRWALQACTASSPQQSESQEDNSIRPLDYTRDPGIRTHICIFIFVATVQRQSRAWSR